MYEVPVGRSGRDRFREERENHGSVGSDMSSIEAWCAGPLP
jgi:hypothetical protein